MVQNVGFWELSSCGLGVEGYSQQQGLVSLVVLISAQEFLAIPAG